MKKLNMSILLSVALVIFACKSKETVLDEMLNLNNASTLYEGSFVSANNYTTMGTVRIVNQNGKKMLVLENFRTTPGPDLKVYVATSTNPTDFTDLGDLKASTGTFSYELDSSLDVSKRNQVLIWCRQFSRLFGSATLTKK
jgi:hypothetical protein